MGLTEMQKLEAGLPYRCDDPELAKMKDAVSLRCVRLNAVDPLDAAGGAVVTKDVPDNCAVAGVPAKVVRELEG